MRTLVGATVLLAAVSIGIWPGILGHQWLTPLNEPSLHLALIVVALAALVVAYDRFPILRRLVSAAGLRGSRS